VRLVELVAPAAAGKSSLSRAVLGHRRARGRTWVDARSLVRPGRVPGGATLARMLGPRWAAGTRGDLLLAAPGEDAIARSLGAVADDWADFLSVVTAPGSTMAIGDDARIAALDLLARRWFVEAVQLRALLATALVDRPRSGLALLDEGLLHPYKVRAGVGPDLDRQARYLATVPLPDVVLHLDVPDGLVVERLVRLAAERPDRLRLALLPIDDPAALAAAVARDRDAVTAAVETARSRGASVHTIDGSLDLDTQVERVLAVTREATA
jgi:hypothetical protein